MEGYVTEGYYSIEPFDFSMTLLISKRRTTSVDNWYMNSLQHMFTPLLVTVDMIDLVVPLIYSYVCCLLCS